MDDNKAQLNEPFPHTDDFRRICSRRFLIKHIYSKKRASFEVISMKKSINFKNSNIEKMSIRENNVEKEGSDRFPLVPSFPAKCSKVVCFKGITCRLYPWVRETVPFSDAMTI